jgi:hypothetical protein
MCGWLSERDTDGGHAMALDNAHSRDYEET